MNLRLSSVELRKSRKSLQPSEPQLNFMGRSFLQTTEWLDFQKSLGRKTWHFDDGKIRANIIKHDLLFKKSYLYIPHGPEILFDEIKSGLSNELKNFISYLKKTGKEEKSIFIKMEPLLDTVPELLRQTGIKIGHSSKNIQPHKTVILHLDLPEEELLSRMHHKTRYNINLASKKGLQLIESDGIKAFWKLLKKTAKTDRFATHNFEYYERLLGFFKNSEISAKLFFVNYENKPIAGAIILTYRDTADYLHGASDRDYRNLMAPYFMHWEIIKKFKSLKFQYYDFWGIDANKWPGVTRFKLGFEGQVVEYPGSFDLPISKIWYLIYKIARKIF
ncbi:MAG: hypothetical protein A3C64_02800 [Candidatus Yanofskybacteria bacterium RIFCSPHIGHO2_02_FULL_41_12]|nr:MAG: hypothetical protein A3C64_02800 [Candidatus Yanofskybacteria bacterium RIFCSPHIGHO2_02_FULL_41_12]